MDPQFWDAFWPAVFGALVGAASAALLEQRYRKERRITNEIGQCNKLIFTLGQMLTSLESINEDLFAGPRRKLGRDPEWHEVGALVGGPAEGPDFIIGEYTFLLEDDDPSGLAPEMLGRIYHAEANFRHTLARVEERSRLWHEYHEQRAAGSFGKGMDALPGMAVSAALTARLKELSGWLGQDLAEWTQSIRTVMPLLYRVLTAKYPKRRFIRLWPTDDPQAPPL